MDKRHDAGRKIQGSPNHKGRDRTSGVSGLFADGGHADPRLRG